MFVIILVSHTRPLDFNHRIIKSNKMYANDKHYTLPYRCPVNQCGFGLTIRCTLECHGYHILAIPYHVRIHTGIWLRKSYWNVINIIFADSSVLSVWVMMVRLDIEHSARICHVIEFHICIHVGFRPMMNMRNINMENIIVITRSMCTLYYILLRLLSTSYRIHHNRQHFH